MRVYNIHDKQVYEVCGRDRMGWIQLRHPLELKGWEQDIKIVHPLYFKDNYRRVTPEVNQDDVHRPAV